MILFRSKYRKRIEFKILKLKMQLSEVQREEKVFERFGQSRKVYRYWTREREIESDINLLKEILTGEII